jgi:acetolactate synthase-1/2/3 large subunit
MTTRSGGEILIDALFANDIDTIFGVPGESYLEALDAIYERRNSFRFITCRQEGGAAFMADAWASATGRIGACFVTRGPGVTNASIGLHNAYQSSTPLLLLVGQVPRHQMEREAFQEIDYRQMLRPVAKWVAQIDQAERIPEFVNRAVHVAQSGRPGPVALVLPEDMLCDHADVEDLPRVGVARTGPGPFDINGLENMLSAAKRPLLVLGGSNWTIEGREAVHAFAFRNHLPVVTGFRRQSLFDNTHKCYSGNLGYGSFPYLNDYAVSSDLIIAIGSRLADATSLKYKLVTAPRPRQKLVHVLSSPDELGKVLTPDLAICSDLNIFAQTINAHVTIDRPVWEEATAELAHAHRSALVLEQQAGPIDMSKVMEYLRSRLTADTIVTNGAGNFADWPNKLYAYRGHRTTLAPISGAMGYGVPAAVAAKVAFPNRTVVAFSGDGDFLMNGQEIATAVQYGVNPIILVVNNGSYGTIRMHQERRFPGRNSGTDLHNPDFAAYAKSFGANGEIVERTEEFAPAFERALSATQATVIELRVGKDSFGPDTSLSGLRVAAE